MGWSPSDWIALAGVGATALTGTAAIVDRSIARRQASRDALNAAALRVLAPIRRLLIDADPIRLTMFGLTPDTGDARLGSLYEQWDTSSPQLLEVELAHPSDRVTTLAREAHVAVSNCLALGSLFVRDLLSREHLMTLHEVNAGHAAAKDAVQTLVEEIRAESMGWYARFKRRLDLTGTGSASSP